MDAVIKYSVYCLENTIFCNYLLILYYIKRVFRRNDKKNIKDDALVSAIDFSSFMDEHELFARAA